MGSQVQVLSDPPNLTGYVSYGKIDTYDEISWGLSLVGRAPALHAGGQEFDSPSLHQSFENARQAKCVVFEL